MSENINEIIAKMYEEHREKLRRLAECIIHDYYASYDMVEDTFLHLVIHAEWLIKLTEPMKIRYIFMLQADMLKVCHRNRQGVHGSD